MCHPVPCGQPVRGAQLLNQRNLRRALKRHHDKGISKDSPITSELTLLDGGNHEHKDRAVLLEVTTFLGDTYLLFQTTAPEHRGKLVLIRKAPKTRFNAGHVAFQPNLAHVCDRTTQMANAFGAMIGHTLRP